MKVPLSPDGGIQHFPTTLYERNPGYNPALANGPHNRYSIMISPVWAEVSPFWARLHLTGMERGKSAAYFWWEEEKTGKVFPMFMKDLSDLLTQGSVIQGYANYRWEPCKRGQNYGIRLAK